MQVYIFIYMYTICIEFDSIALARGNQGTGDNSNDQLSRKLLAEMLLQLSQCKKLVISKASAVDSAHESPYLRLEEKEYHPGVDSIEMSSTPSPTCTKKRKSVKEKCKTFESHESQRLHLKGISSQSHADHHQCGEIMNTLSPPLKIKSTINPTDMIAATNTYQPVVIAATNRIEDIDEAIMRRFESKILVEKLNQEDRIELLQKYLHDTHHDITREDFIQIGECTNGWTGSEIEVCVQPHLCIQYKYIYTPMPLWLDTHNGRFGDT